MTAIEELRQELVDIWRATSAEAPHNQFLLNRWRIIEDAPRDYVTFSNIVLLQWYMPAVTAGAGCICPHCKETRAIRRYVKAVAYAPEPDKPVVRQGVLL